VVVALAVMLVWGGTPLFSKVAAQSIEPLQAGALRTLLAGAIALPLVAALRRPLPSDRRGRGLLAFSGFAAFIGFPLVFSVAQHATSALHGALILATMPVFTSLFGHLIERRRVSRAWMLGCVLALTGEAAVIVIRVGDAGGSTSLLGDAGVLLAALIASTGYVAGARLSQRGYPAFDTTLWGAGLAAVALVPVFGLLVWRDGWSPGTPAAWVSLAILAVLTSIVGYVAWYWALARGGIGRIASVQFTQPLFGLALAAIVLGERPAPVTAVAGVAILAGAWIVRRSA
jgi:drug/metabolite transporter (DMT)-like permease